MGYQEFFLQEVHPQKTHPQGLISLQIYDFRHYDDSKIYIFQSSSQGNGQVIKGLFVDVKQRKLYNVI